MLGGDFGNSSEERENSSELQNLSSEVSFHSSELLFPGSVGNFRLFGSGSQFPREKSQSAEMPASLQSKPTALYSEVLAISTLAVLLGQEEKVTTRSDPAVTFRVFNSYLVAI